MSPAPAFMLASAQSHGKHACSSTYGRCRTSQNSTHCVFQARHRRPMPKPEHRSSVDSRKGSGRYPRPQACPSNIASLRTSSAAVTMPPARGHQPQFQLIGTARSSVLAHKPECPVREIRRTLRLMTSSVTLLGCSRPVLSAPCARTHLRIRQVCEGICAQHMPRFGPKCNALPSQHPFWIKQPVPASGAKQASKGRVTIFSHASRFCLP